MVQDPDSGIDKRKILDEIGASAPLPGEPPPSPPRALAAPPLMAAGGLSAMAPPAPPGPEAAPAAAVPIRRPEGRFARHRRRIAALLLMFAGMVWMGVALATQEGTPYAFGGSFLGLAALTGFWSLLREA